MSEQNTRKTHTGGDVSEKIFNTRIIHKHDTEANWKKATNFIPKQGELIVYDPDENYTYSRLKIGDGITKVNNLPFHAGTWEEIADKPFYVIDEEVVVLEVAANELQSYLKKEFVLEEGITYTIVYGDKVYTETAELQQWPGGSAPDIVLGDPGNWYRPLFNIPYGVSLVNQEVCRDERVPLKVSYYKKEIKYLDERVIPDTIARVADIPTGALADKDIVSKEDLDSSVQQSLDKADTAFQPSSYVNTNLSEWTKQMCEEAYADFQNGKAVIGRIRKSKWDDCQVICISGGWDNYESCNYLNFIRDNPYGNQELYSLYFGGLYTVYYVEKGERLYVPGSPTKDYVLTGTGTSAQWKELSKIEAMTEVEIDEICNASIYAASEVLI